MADTTTNLEMPFILPSQAQKHVTHNEALLKLDALVHLIVLDERAAPPMSPEDGACYLVATGATDTWSSKDAQIAIWQDGGWNFATPRTGWRAWFATVARLRVFTGTVWADIPLPETGTISQLGINTTPDQVNRLSLASPASLFNHAGNGHQIKVNKSAPADTASLLFQTSYTGYAEMGLAGDNRFSVKVSDGSDWKTGLSISPSGHVSRPNQPAARVYRAGASFSPADGQQSGFTDFAANQGGFTFGASVPGGGNRLVVPASGVYLIAISLSVITSLGYSVRLMLNGSETLAFVNGISGAQQTQCNFGIFFLNMGDFLTLNHTGTGQFEAGSGKTALSIAML